MSTLFPKHHLIKMTLTIRLGKDTGRLSSIQSNGELSHGMHILWQSIQQWNDMGGQHGRTFVKFLGEGIDLFFGGYLRGEEEPD